MGRCKHPGCCNQCLKKDADFRADTRKWASVARVAVRSRQPLASVAYIFESLTKASVDTQWAVGFAASSFRDKMAADDTDASACRPE